MQRCHGDPDCKGKNLPGELSCLAHAREATRSRYLDALVPGADVNHDGTVFDDPLLTALLRSLQDTSGRASFGTCSFRGTQFPDGASFEDALFGQKAVFDGASFGVVSFDGAAFREDAWFEGARFARDASFFGATFAKESQFSRASFECPIHFSSTSFV
ncbi:pentapeptide repeat-containing protein [Streptomyces sp. NPDC056738]|uniref:pentapeptide repeat-containing protein n=1 Tax=Streptomyces sp. NPDC056738 TaxID=3345933 RepID=UPI00367A7806